LPQKYCYNDYHKQEACEMSALITDAKELIPGVLVPAPAGRVECSVEPISDNQI